MHLLELFRLDELVNAPDLEVYHWTNAQSMYNMFKKNVIKAETTHELNGKEYTGVSLTRNALFDIQHTYAIGGIKAWRIGINLRKLKADYQVFPIRYQPYRKIPRNKSVKAGAFNGMDLIGFHSTSSDEAEEFCVGDIYPMWHYVSSLAVEMRNVAIDTHPNEMKHWEPEDFDNGDGDFGSAYSRADQGLLFDIMVGTFYGQEAYSNAWAKWGGGGKRKSAIRLPDHLPFNIIDRTQNRILPFKDVANRYLEAIDAQFPDEPDIDQYNTLDDSQDQRDERSRHFDQKTKRHRGFE